MTDVYDSDTYRRGPSRRGWRTGINLLVWAATIICAFAVSGCSDDTDRSTFVSRPVPKGHVLLMPELQGGWAGWSMTMSYQTATEGGSSDGPLTRTSTGPIFAEGSCEESKFGIKVYVLTTQEVAAVSMAGGMPIPTATNSTLPDGLRAAAVEIVRQNGRPSIGLHCPRRTALDAHGKLINGRASRVGHKRLDCPARGTGKSPHVHQGALAN